MLKIKMQNMSKKSPHPCFPAIQFLRGSQYYQFLPYFFYSVRIQAAIFTFYLTIRPAHPHSFSCQSSFRTFSDALIIFNNILNCSLCLQPLFSLYILIGWKEALTYQNFTYYNFCSPSPLNDIFILELLRPKSLVSSLTPVFLQSTYSLLANPVGCAFKIYPEFYCFSPHLIPNTMEEATVILTEVIAIVFYLVSLLLLLPPHQPASYLQCSTQNNLVRKCKSEHVTFLLKINGFPSFSE